MKRQNQAGTRHSYHKAVNGFEPLEDRLVLSSASVFQTEIFHNVGAQAATDQNLISENLAAESVDIRVESTVSNSNSGSNRGGPDIQAQALKALPVNNDNTYKSARNIGALTGTKKFHDYVGRGDRRDIFKFRVNEQTDVRIKLYNLQADAELRLLDGNRELVKWSLHSGTEDEFIRAILEPGTYYIRIDAFDGTQSGDYDLRVTTVDPRPDTGGNSLDNPTDLGKVDNEKGVRISGWVGNGDKWDYYQILVDQFVNMRAILNRLSANANLHLYDSDQNLMASSTNGGTRVDRITTDLSPGVYVFGVESVNSHVNYQLVLNTDPVEDSGRLPDADYYGMPARDANLNAIYAPEAWNAGITGKDVVVAVIDSGVDSNHRDLAGQFWINTDEIAGDGIDNDNNGYIDDVSGWDFTDGDNTPNDLNGHGTHVAGIIASARNRFGSTGVAYNANIMPIRVLDADGDGSFGDLAKGIYYAVDNGADVINLSIGGDYNYSVRAAIAYANSQGVFVSAATGNGGVESPFYPARHSGSINNVLSVGAHNASDSHAWFSNYVGNSGAVQVDAPGVNIFSTLPGSRYGRYSGTSSAAPFVSGLAALVLSVDPNFTPNLVRQFITEGAIRDISGSDSIGGIDAARTLYLARGYGGDPGGGGFGDDGSDPGTPTNGQGGPNIQKQNLEFWNSRLASAINVESIQPIFGQIHLERLGATESGFVFHDSSERELSSLLTSLYSAESESLIPGFGDSVNEFISEDSLAFGLNYTDSIAYEPSSADELSTFERELHGSLFDLLDARIQASRLG